MRMNLRVRFAPSPTGQLHIGGVRTALFNFLFARNNNGKFLVRIEDTDRERSKQEYTDQICDSLEWLGLNWDDELVFQSMRTERYQDVVANLLKQGKAYRCFASRDELEIIRKETGSYQYPGIWRDRSAGEIKTELSKGTPYTIRLRSPQVGTTKVDDIIYGNIHVANSELDDFILIRSDGSPVYNLVVAVDDHDMNISHVIRGEDHVSNTPKQILIYQALNWDIPNFAHLPMILGSDGKRLSKRHGATGLQSYRDKGYQPIALLNYLALLGWNPGTEQEIMHSVELISKFRLDQVHKKSAIFDRKKLDWISGQYLARQKNQDILSGIRNIQPHWGQSRNGDYCSSVIELLKCRSRSLMELIEQSEYFFNDPDNYNPENVKTFWEDDAGIILETLLEKLNKLSDWESSAIEIEFKNLMNKNHFGLGQIMKPVRFAICGTVNGPSLYSVMALLGRDSCIYRIDSALNFLENN